MKFWHWFPFFRSRAEAQRREDMNFHLKIAELKRHAATIRKEADRAKTEAVQLERSGDHGRAVAKAAAADNQEKSYRTALTTISTCESMHAQAKTQNALKQLMISCRDISLAVTKEADMEGAVKAQTQLQQAAVRLEESQEAMAAFQEGFDVSADPQLRNEAGEAALAQIMQEQAEKDKQAVPALPEEPKAIPAPQDEAHQQWVAQRRKMLTEMANDPT